MIKKLFKWVVDRTPTYTLIYLTRGRKTALRYYHLTESMGTGDEDHYGSHGLKNAFVWIGTIEGHEYWGELYKELGGTWDNE